MAQDMNDVLGVVSLAQVLPQVIPLAPQDGLCEPLEDSEATCPLGLSQDGRHSVRSGYGAALIVLGLPVVQPDHHTGKDARQGMRGHSSLIAALDAAVEVSRDAEGPKWTVTKAKDGAEGDAHPFTLQVETLGVDGHGDDITSCVVTDTAESISTQRERLPRGSKVAMAAMHLVIEQQGVEPPSGVRARFGLLAPTRVVTEDIWRQASYLEGITDADAEQDSKRRAFTRARLQLLDLAMVGTYDGFVWPS